ncbi:MAG: plasmid recombination protein [Ruminococcus sp.]|nr:plasmid recombination protein [Ruminococcus sp.]
MSYAIIRNKNYKINAVPLMERHNERLNHNYSNKDIDLSRTSENYHLKRIQAESYQQEFKRIRTRQGLKGNLRLHGEKQSTVLCEFVITSDKEFFDRIGKERTKKFFQDAYDFVTAKAGGEQYVLSAVVHMDEATPHMHVAFIPVINGKDRKGNPCKRINCSEFWKGRDSYSRLQDEYYDFITSRGYDLERGEKGSTAEHLSVAEYKLKKTEEQLASMSEQIAEIENIEEVKATNLPLNTVAIKRDDFEMLSAAAKKHVGTKNAEAENVQLKAECTKLKSENEALKSARDNLSGQLHQLEYEYGRFYETVADEVDFAEENEMLKKENEVVSLQVHTLSDDVRILKEERYQLEKQIENKDEELIQTKSLLKALQEKFDRVMDFIKRHNLKEKLEEFLKPKTHHRSI